MPISSARGRKISGICTIVGIRIRPAEATDVDTVADLLSEAATWTAAIGFANWPARFRPASVLAGIERGEIYVAELDSTIVATVTFTWSDPAFWGDQPPDAGYVHRLAVRRDHAGAGLGALLLDWAGDRVRAAGRSRLRLDVTPENRPLRAYYERLGFEPCGTVEGDATLRDGETRHWIAQRYERNETSR